VNVQGPLATTRDKIWSGRMLVAGRTGGNNWDVQILHDVQLSGTSVDDGAPALFPIVGGQGVALYRRKNDTSNDMFVNFPCTTSLLQLRIHIDTFASAVLQ
jgi:hypothetical protein